MNSTSFSATLRTACNGYVASDGVSRATPAVAYTCPAPLVIPDDPAAPLLPGLNCAAPCPTLIFAESDYEYVDVLVCMHVWMDVCIELHCIASHCDGLHRVALRCVASALNWS